MAVPNTLAARWRVGARDEVAEAVLQNELGIPALVAAVLVSRGITDPTAAHKFLNPSLDDLHDPRLLPDYESAEAEILGAKERGELIFIHGDYDVDGVTSAALLYRFLTKIGANVHVHVPHRMNEGYGIHASAVDAAQAMGAKLFLTCDCGVAAHEQVLQAHAAGMRVVITDHHEIDGKLPEAAAVVNAHRLDHSYPFADLSGVGVVFKVCAGIAKTLGYDLRQFYRAYLDLAVLGTVADVMPLLGENRIITRYGLPLLKDTNKEGLKALLRVSKSNLPPGEDLKAWHIGFRLGPRLNAAGRIDDAALSLQLLLEKDPATAREIAQKLDEINSERRAEQELILDAAIEQVFAKELHKKPLIVVDGDGWHPGIVGIVAGKIAERFHRPTFVLSTDKETQMARGSARSIPGFDLSQAIQVLKAKGIATGGGHAAAAGIGLSLDKLADVRSRLVLHAHENLTEEDLTPVTPIDCELDFHHVSREATESMNLLEPFGMANPEPRFLVCGVEFMSVQATRSADHYRLTLRHPDGTTRSAMGFGLGERLASVPNGSFGDVIVRPVIETYLGNTTFKWHLKDFVVKE